MIQELLSLLFSEIETIVNETPSEVVSIELTIAIIIHGLEDARNSLNSRGRPLTNLLLYLSNQVVDIEAMQLLYWCSMGRSRCGE